ncbi:hypothetical protein C8R44DRAFT_991628 [Mycena epipterygia]|nr:hypothetical protein C8R44DRAFT_991628 [Mycena epipterygia]
MSGALVALHSTSFQWHPPYSPALDGSLGALEIGMVVGIFLFGILTLQTFNYYRQFPDDSKTLKITIGILWLLDLGHTICCIHGIYAMTVTFYGEPPEEIILNPPPSHILSLVFSGGIYALVQIFYGNRIRVLSGRFHVFFLCIPLAVMRFTCDMVLMSSFWIYKEGYLGLKSKVHWEMVTVQILGPTGDILIALAMCYCLWQLRKSEFHRARSMVDTLLIWTFETALVTSVSAILQLILVNQPLLLLSFHLRLQQFLTRTDLTFMIFYLIQPKLFSNSMLAVLNGRTRFRSAEASIGIGTQPLAFESAGTKSRREEDHRDHILVETAARIRSVPSVVVHISPTYIDNDKADIFAKTI